VRILGISGSLRRGSHNRTLLRAAAAALPPGAVLVEWEGLTGLPAFDEDQEREPAGPVRALLEEIAAADALLIATPEYNASLPGALKNALDWASRPFPFNVLRCKPSAVIGASTGPFGAVWAQAELRKVLTASGAHVLDAELPVGMADGAFAADGSLADPALSARLRGLLSDLVRAGAPAQAPPRRTRPVVPAEGCARRSRRGGVCAGR
jgi:chromate reductase